MDEIFAYSQAKKCKVFSIRYIGNAAFNWDIFIVTDYGKHKTFFGKTKMECFNLLKSYYGEDIPVKKGTDSFEDLL